MNRTNERAAHMQPMSDGMNLDPQMHVQVLQNKLAQTAIREAQMETAIQQLMSENQELSNRINEIQGEPVNDVIEAAE